MYIDLGHNRAIEIGVTNDPVQFEMIENQIFAMVVFITVITRIKALGIELDDEHLTIWFFNCYIGFFWR